MNRPLSVCLQRLHSAPIGSCVNNFFILLLFQVIYKYDLLVISALLKDIDELVEWAQDSVPCRSPENSHRTDSCSTSNIDDSVNSSPHDDKAKVKGFADIPGQKPQQSPGLPGQVLPQLPLC